MKKFIAICLVAFMLVACGDKTLDASTQEKFNQSVESIVEGLSADERQQFAESIMTLMFTASFEAKGNQDKAFEIFKEKANGKTVKEIISAADLIKADKRPFN